MTSPSGLSWMLSKPPLTAEQSSPYTALLTGKGFFLLFGIWGYVAVFLMARFFRKMIAKGIAMIVTTDMNE